MEPPRARLVKWVEARIGVGARWKGLAGDGSDKTFWRLILAGKTLVAVDGSRLEEHRFAENRAFLHIGEHLGARGVPVPGIKAADAGSGFFLIEDLGDTRLADSAPGLDPAGRERLYRQVLEVLADMQIRGSRGFDIKWCAQTARYDREMILRYESYYFIRAFAQKYCGSVEEPPGLGRELAGLARRAAESGPLLFLHRDFQSRNIMIHKDRIRIIDYQGGRLGPPGYDLASLLLDPYVGLSPKEQKALREYYLSLTRDRLGLDADRFEQDYKFLALHRLMQMLGAFAFLARQKDRPGFEEHIPAALARLRNLLNEPEFADRPVFRGFVDSLKMKKA